MNRMMYRVLAAHNYTFATPVGRLADLIYTNVQCPEMMTLQGMSSHSLAM